MALSTRSNYNIANNVKLASEVFEKHGEFIRTIINFQLSDKGLVDDIYQDFFISLVTKPTHEEIRNIRGYLYRAVTNHITGAKRKTRRYQAAVRRYSEHLEFATNKKYSDDTIGSMEEIGKMSRTIEKYITHTEAQAIKLRYVNDHSIKETAAKMGVKPRSVSRYLSVGFNKIRQGFLL